MNFLDDRTLDERPMEQLDLDLGDTGRGFFPPRTFNRTLGADEDDIGKQLYVPHQVDTLDIEGRAYELDCRICPITRMVVGYVLRRSPAAAIA